MDSRSFGGVVRADVSPRQGKEVGGGCWEVGEVPSKILPARMEWMRRCIWISLVAGVADAVKV